MNNGSSLGKTAVMMFCDSVWIYFIIMLFAAPEQWLESYASHPLLWTGIPCLALLISLSAGKLPPRAAFVVHVLVLAVVLLPLWKNGYDANWSYSFIISAAIAYLYIRTSLHTFSPPSRLQMLLRFEGTVALYFFLVIVNEVRDVFPWFFHLLFGAALLLSLSGMLFTLYENEEDNGQEILTKTSGSPGSLPVIFGVIGGGAGLLFVLLFIPGIQHAFTALLTVIWEGLVWIGTGISNGFMQLMNLLPRSETEGGLPSAPETPEVSDAERPSSYIQLPIPLILTISAILIGIMALWLTSRLLKKRRPSSRVTMQRTRIPGEPLTRMLLRWLRRLFARLRHRWLRRFPAFYSFYVYWEFHQFRRWAGRRGIHRQAGETALEFAERSRAALSMEDTAAQSLQQLALTYSAVYYSEGRTAPDYNPDPLKQFMKQNKYWSRG
ncbi:DUF4129 domain-containing protein [Salibacterium sp. K-3]